MPRTTAQRSGVGLALILLSFGAAASWGAGDAATPADRVIAFLNQTIGLYQQTTIQEHIAIEPQEQLLLYDNRQIADQIVRFAFDFARAQVDAMEPVRQAPPAGAVPSQYSALGRMLANLEKTVRDARAEADADTRALATTRGAQRARTQSEISELQGEIALAEARRDAVRSMLEFVTGTAASNLGPSGLKAQIDALAASVPAATSTTSNTAQVRNDAAPLALAASAPAPTGIWDLVADIRARSAKLQTVNSMIEETTAVQRTASDLRGPLVGRMKALSTQGDQLAAQADTANRSLLLQERQQLDALASQFKQITAVLIPLSKQRVLLNAYQKNLLTWRDGTRAGYNADLRSLGIRLGLLGLMIAALFGLSALWRRAVFRYVHEARRRHQWLLIRKLALWFVVAVTVAITLAGRLSSFVTFAGLLTAGVAVALQNVIVSMVGYLFLIGQYGIRVGDRVEVSGTSGEVIDIGLVRFHLMELGHGATPTGRVVAFSNSVVFQPTAGLFKQIPGASFAWHQVTLTVPRDIDFPVIKEQILGAVERVIADYRDKIERVYGEMEKRGVLFSKHGLTPKLELRLTPGGIEATIRYPVDLQHAADIDARVSRALMTALERDAALHTPDGTKVRVKTEVSA